MWKDGHAGAISLTFDDGVTASYDHSLVLDAYGFKSTFFIVSGLSLKEPPTAGYIGIPQVQDLYDRGHEIGCHTKYHWQDFYDRIPSPYATYADYATVEYGSWYTTALAALSIPESQLRFSLAYPAGSRNTSLDAAASVYSKSARGYYLQDDETYPGRLVGLNNTTPASPDGVMLLSVYSPYAEDGLAPSSSFAAAAVAQGKWAIWVSHTTLATSFYDLLATLDVWVAPQGRVVEYIRIRDSLHVGKFNARGAAPKILQFTISDGVGLDTTYYKCPISIQVTLHKDDVVSYIQRDGEPIAYTDTTTAGVRSLMFESSLVEPHDIMIRFN